MPNMNVYCMKHDELHAISFHKAERLIYQYQLRIVEAATSDPLPANELTDRAKIIQNAFCVAEDDHSDNIIPEWRAHIDQCMSGRRRAMDRLKARSVRVRQAKHREKVRNQ